MNKIAKGVIIAAAGAAAGVAAAKVIDLINPEPESETCDGGDEAAEQASDLGESDGTAVDPDIMVPVAQPADTNKVEA